MILYLIKNHCYLPSSRAIHGWVQTSGRELKTLWRHNKEQSAWQWRVRGGGAGVKTSHNLRIIICVIHFLEKIANSWISLTPFSCHSICFPVELQAFFIQCQIYIIILLLCYNASLIFLSANEWIFPKKEKMKNFFIQFTSDDVEFKVTSCDIMQAA